MKGYEVVVGIDFGSSGTGFAYSFFNENRIFPGEIKGASANKKIPTELILDDNNMILYFGAECEIALKEKGLDAGHYFKGIKMHLYENKKKIIASNSEKELPIKLIIQIYLEKIKEIAINQISQNRPNLRAQPDKIKWVVTVPAIWDERQKGVMMEACIAAGLINNNTDKSLFFALEPEAASLYCSRNKEIEQAYFKKGEYYIVCDLGGGTGDIVAHFVGSNQRLEEKNPSCGGNYGSNEINKLILKEIFQRLFGCHDFNTYYKKLKKNNANNINYILDMGQSYNDWFELEGRIQQFKEWATPEKIRKGEKKTIDCTLFKDIFNEDIKLEELINEYNDNIFNDNIKLSIKNSNNKWLIEFPYQIIYNYMEKQAESICNIINDINSKENIHTLIFVGGYCSNEIITTLIRNGLKDIQVVLKPSEPGTAIMNGAVLFGINPTTIELRKAKYTIGINLNRECDNNANNLMDDNKYYDREKKKWFYKNLFDKYIEVDQSLKFGEIISHDLWMTDKRHLELHFFKTKKKNPRFVNEGGITEIGTFVLDIEKEYEKFEDREVAVKMKFGGTFIDVVGLHKKSGILSKKSTFHFD